MNTEEIKHVRDLVLADMLNGNYKTINGSILRKLDKQLTIPVVVGRSEQLKPLTPNECEQCGVLIDHRLNECGNCQL